MIPLVPWIAGPAGASRGFYSLSRPQKVSLQQIGKSAGVGFREKMTRVRSPGLEHDLIGDNPAVGLHRAIVLFGVRDPGFIRGVIIIAVVDDTERDLPVAQDGSEFL